MTRSMGPFSLSIWDEPGLLVKGFDHSPTVMMGHNKPDYEAWAEAAGYHGVKDLMTYELDVTQTMPQLVQRIVAIGARNQRLSARNVDQPRIEDEVAIILVRLTDARDHTRGCFPQPDE